MARSPWTVHLVETLTGRLRAELPLAEGGSWTDAINGPTAITAKVPTPWLMEHVERSFWEPKRASLLACHLGEPIVLGPILAVDSDPASSTLTAGGLWNLLEGRTVTDRDRTNGAELAKSRLTITEGSLGTIARRVVEAVQDRPNGWFPISYGSPSESGSNRTRTYKGFNLSNNESAKRIGEITEVINGPDVAFRCRWRRRDEIVEWVMVHGTEGMPEIGQEDMFVVEAAAPRGNAVAMNATLKHDPVHRVYATGAGEDEATLIEVASTRPPDGMPFVEMVISDAQIENAALLRSKARAVLTEGATVQIATEVVAGDEMPLHKWWAGDEMRVSWPKGWPQLKDGTYRMRLLSRSGDFSSTKVQCEFQPEGVAL